jgi:hypothetical protein
MAADKWNDVRVFSNVVALKCCRLLLGVGDRADAAASAQPCQTLKK